MTTASPITEPSTYMFEQIIQKSLKPDVQKIDHEGYYPESFMREYGAAGAFKPTSESHQLYSAIHNCGLVGEVCGSTAFSIWCHNTCLWYLTNTENTPLREKYLSTLADASQLGATGLSNPVKSFFGIERMKLRGEKTPNGYRVKGTLPWVSNLLEGHIFGGIFDTPKGPVMAIFDCARSDIRLKPSGPFIALEGTATQAVTCMEAEIHDDMILAVNAKAFLNQVKAGFILLQMGIGLGLMKGAIHDMHRANKTLGHTNCYLPEGPDYFEEQLELLHERTKALAHDPVAYV